MRSMTSRHSIWKSAWYIMQWTARFTFILLSTFTNYKCNSNIQQKIFFWVYRHYENPVHSDCYFQCFFSFVSFWCVYFLVLFLCICCCFFFFLEMHDISIGAVSRYCCDRKCHSNADSNMPWCTMHTMRIHTDNAAAI